VGEKMATRRTKIDKWKTRLSLNVASFKKKDIGWKKVIVGNKGNVKHSKLQTSVEIKKKRNLKQFHV